MKSRVHPKYKTKYHVGNWSAYDRALVQRGDIRVVGPGCDRQLGGRVRWHAWRAAAVFRSRHRNRADRRRARLAPRGRPWEISATPTSRTIRSGSSGPTAPPAAGSPISPRSSAAPRGPPRSPRTRSASINSPGAPPGRPPAPSTGRPRPSIACARSPSTGAGSTPCPASPTASARIPPARASSSTPNTSPSAPGVRWSWIEGARGKVHPSRGGDGARGRPVGGPGDRAGLRRCSRPSSAPRHADVESCVAGATAPAAPC